MVNIELTLKIKWKLYWVEISWEDGDDVIAKIAKLKDNLELIIIQNN
jgi:hypothetical protein